MRTGALVLLLPLTLAGWSVAGAQGRASIVGVVVSGERAEPVERARVVITLPTGSDTTLITSVDGRFALARLAAGRYAIRASWNGASSVATSVDLRSNERFEAEFTVPDRPGAGDSGVAALPELTVREAPPPEPASLVDTFEERRSRGLGQYLTETEIDERPTARLMDLVRSFRGVRVSCGRFGCVPRMARAPRGCVSPSYFIDDSPVDEATAVTTPATEIRGIEVYAGLSEVPGELARDHWVARCGVIAIWTRRGPEPDTRRPPRDSAPRRERR